MAEAAWGLWAVIAIALIFDYINGMHDAANAIATVVSTRVLTPRQAILLAAFTNLVGALRHAMATTGYTDLKEFQRVEMVVTA